MGYDISKITLSVSLGDTSKTVASMNALIKTLESKKVKLEVDSSSLRASLSVMSSEIEKMYAQELDAKKKTENEKVSYTKQKNAEAMAYLKQQQSEIEKMYGVSSKLSFNQNPNTGQITSAIISYTTELGKAERVSYSLKEAITGVTSEGKKLGEIKLAPTNQNFTNDIVKVNTELQKAQESLDKFKTSMATNIANISVGKNGDMANQLQVFEQLKIKFAELQNFKLNTSNLSEYKTKINEVNELYTQTKTKITEVNTTQAQMTSSFKLDSNMTNKVKDLNQQLDIMLSKNGSLANNNLFNQIRQDVEKLGSVSNLTQFNNQVKDIQRNMGLLRSESSSSIGVFSKLGQSIKSAFSFVSLSMAMYQFASQVRQIPELITEVDSSLVELNKVANLSESQLDSFTDSAYRVGEELAKTGKQVIDASTEFVKAGYNINQSAELAKDALLSMNVGSGMSGNLDGAVSSMIATLKGFGMEADKSEDIVDKMAKVADNCAVSYSDLANGIERSSAVLSAGGFTFEQTLASLTGVYEITRDMEKASTGLNTVVQRLRGISDEGEFSEETLAGVEKKLYDIAGIKLKDDITGQLRNSFDVISDLEKKWDSLSKNQQAILGEAITGKRQAVILQSLLKNWQGVETAIKATSEATGYANEVNERFMDSINGRVQALKSSWEQLAITTLSSDVVKNIVSATTEIVKFIDECGGLVPILTTILGLVIAIKAQSLSTFVGATIKSLGNLTFAFKAVVGGAATLNESLAFLNLNPVVLAISAITLALGGGVMAWNKYKSRVEEVKKVQLELAEANIKEAKSIEELSKKYNEATGLDNDKEKKDALLSIQKDLVESYGVEAKNIDLVNGSYEEQIKLLDNLKNKKLEASQVALNQNYNDTKDELDKILSKDFFAIRESLNPFENLDKQYEEAMKSVNGLFGKDVVFEDFNGWMHFDVDNAEEYQQVLEQLLLSLQQQGVYDGARFNELTNQYNELTNAIKNYQDAADIKFGNRYKIDASNIADKLGIKDLSNMTTEELNKFKIEFNDILSNPNMKDNLYANYCLDIIKGLSSVSDATDSVTPSVQNTDEAFKSMLSTFGNGEVDILTKALDELNTNMKLSDATSEELASKYPDIFEGCQSVADGIENINKQINQNRFEKLNSDATSTASNVKLLDSAMKELKESSSGKLSSSTISSLIKEYPDLISYVNDEIGLREQLSAKIEDEKLIYRDTMTEMLSISEDYYNQKVTGNSETLNKMQDQVSTFFSNLGIAYNVDLKNYTSLENAKKDTTAKLIKELAKGWSKYFNATSGLFDTDSFVADNEETMSSKALQSVIKKNTEIQSKIKEAQLIFDTIAIEGVDLGNIDVGGISSGSGGSSNYAKYVDSIYDSIIKALEEGTDKVDRQIALAKSKLENLELVGTQEEVESANAELEKLYQDRVDIIKSSSEQMVSLRDKIVKELQDVGYEELKGLDLTNISQLDLDKVISNLEKQIDSANTSSSKKLSASLTYKKDLIQDYCNNIISANDNINTMAKDIIDSQNDLADVVIDNIERLYNVLTRPLDDMDLMTRQYESQLKLLELQGEQVSSQVGLYKEMDSQLSTKASHIDGILDKLRTQRSLLEESSQEYRKMTEYIIEMEEQYADTIQKQVDGKNAVIDLLYEEMSLELEKQIYGSGGKDEWTKLNDAKIEALNKELEALSKATEEKEKQAALEKYQLEMAELREKLENAKKQKTVQEFKKQDDGTWQWEYKADAELIASIEKEMNDKEIAEQERLEKEKQKEIEQGLKDEITALQNQEKAKNQLFEQSKTDLKKYLDEEKNLWSVNGDEVSIIVEENLTEISNTFDVKMSNILSNVQDKLNSIRDAFNSAMSMANSMSSIGKGGSGGSSSSSSSNTQVGGTGKEYEVSNDGTITVSRPDGTSSTVSPSDDMYDKTLEAMEKDLEDKDKKYANGGIISHTGLAWVDGTPSKPETIFNYEQMKEVNESMRNYMRLASLQAIIEPQSINAKQVEQAQSIVIQNVELPNVREPIDFVKELGNMFGGLSNMAKLRPTT